ncbi:MAG: EamA family transporter [Alteromonadaceae bacterium]|nr:MAG: EamA family transporter [Alteromonadaceae bacterium]
MTSNRAEYLLIVVTVIAAAGWLFSKNALQEIPAYSFIAMRFIIAAMVLASFCLSQLRSVTGEQLLRSAFTGSVLGFTLLFWILGLQQTASIGMGAFIVSLSIVVVPLIGRALFSQAIPSALFAALLPALIGLALLTIDNGFVLKSDQYYFLIATLGFALHLNLSSHFVSQTPSLANTTIQLTVIGLIAAVAAFLSESWSAPFSPLTWVWLLASAIVATSLRFALQNYALRFMSPSHASMIMLLEPVSTAFLGVWLLGEQFSNNKILGCALILIALLVFRSEVIFAWLKARTSNQN